MRSLHKRCEEDPSFIYSTEPFSVVIPRAQGALILEHNKPVHTSKLLVKSNHYEPDETPYTVEDLASLVDWLTNHTETNIYGVVSIDLGIDMSTAVVDMVANLSDNPSEEATKKAMKEQFDLQKAFAARAKTALLEAREKADARVRAAMKATHNNLMKQWEIMGQEGKGRYTPSVAEAVGAHVLRAEIEKASAARRKSIQSLVDLSNSASV